MKKEQSRPVHYFIAIIAVSAGVLFDQWTKLLVLTHLKGHDSYIVIKNVFELEYLENRGAAFGMLQGKQFFFIFCVALIAFFSIYFYRTVPMTKHFLPLRICAVFILAGAFGNMIDRVIRHYVVDFFYFSLIDFPIFNVADIYVTVSAFGLIILLLFYYKEEDLEQIFHNRKGK